MKSKKMSEGELKMIRYDSVNNRISLDTAHSSLQFAVREGLLLQTYSGPRLRGWAAEERAPHNDPGCYAQYQVYGQRALTKMPDNVTYDEGSMVDTAGTGYNGIRLVGSFTAPVSGDTDGDVLFGTYTPTEDSGD